MIKTSTHYVSDNFVIRIRKVWLVAVVIKILITFKVGDLLFDERGIYCGIFISITLALITLIKGILLEFSDEYEDYVEDNAYLKKYELWIKEK